MHTTDQHVSQDFLIRLRLVREQLAEVAWENVGSQRASRLLGRLEGRLLRPPRIIILGEPNSGKTTLANGLIGCDLLATDIVRNTRVPTILKYARTAVVHLLARDGTRQRVEEGNIDCRVLDGQGVIEVGLPMQCLQTYEIIDTPGSMLADVAEERFGTFDRAADVSRSAHMAIWCTVASQAWRASENAHWMRLRKRAWLQNILCVTHADRLDSADREKVRRRLQSETGHIFESIVMSSGPEKPGKIAQNLDCGSGEASGEDTAARVALALGAIERHRCHRAGQIIHRFLEDLEIAV